MTGRRLVASLAVCALVAGSLTAAQTAPGLDAVSGSVRYEATTGSSTWSGVAPLDADGLTWSGEPEAAVRGTLTLPVDALDSGNRFRDENARLTVFESDVHPEAQFRVRRFERTGGEADGALGGGQVGLPEGRSTWQATGDLTLHGVTRELTVPVAVVRRGSGVTAEASWTVSLAAFDMQAPTFLWLQVEDAVNVSVTLEGDWTPGRP
jgi:polyisoprenoid-binding protein YceI